MEKNHRCSLCDNLYFHEHSLNKHIRNVHKNENISKEFTHNTREIPIDTGDEDEKMQMWSMWKSYMQAYHMRSHEGIETRFCLPCIWYSS